MRDYDNQARHAVAKAQCVPVQTVWLLTPLRQEYPAPYNMAVLIYPPPNPERDPPSQTCCSTSAHVGDATLPFVWQHCMRYTPAQTGWLLAPNQAASTRFPPTHPLKGSALLRHVSIRPSPHMP